VHLEAGVIKMQDLAYEKNKLMPDVTEAFYYWSEENITLGVKYEKVQLIRDLKQRNPDMENLTVYSWTIRIRKWADYKGYLINPHIPRKEDGHFPRDKSGDTEYITFRSKEEATANGQ
jgi:hypothetical protein